MRELMQEAGDPDDTDKILAFRESRKPKNSQAPKVGRRPVRICAYGLRAAEGSVSTWVLGRNAF